MDVGLPAGFAIGLLLGLAVGALLLIAVGGALLRLAVRWVARFTPPYWLSCLVFLGAMVLSTGIQWAIAFAIFLGLSSARWAPPGFALQVASIAGGFAISTTVLAVVSHLLLRAPDGRPLPVGPAFGAAAICVGVGTLIYGVLVVAVVLSLGGMPGLFH